MTESDIGKLVVFTSKNGVVSFGYATALLASETLVDFGHGYGVAIRNDRLRLATDEENKSVYDEERFCSINDEIRHSE